MTHLATRPHKRPRAARRWRSARFCWSVPLVGFAVLLVSCQDSTDASTDDLESAARSYIDAVNAADGETIWAYLSDGCRAATSIDEVVANEATAEHDSFGNIESLSAEVDGETGTVDVETTNGGAALVREWEADGGEWRITRCSYL